MLEALATAIGEDEQLGGLRISPGLKRVKIVPYANDVTVGLKELGIAMRHIRNYEKATGAKLNIAQTNVMTVNWGVGRMGFNRETGSMKILGVHMGIEEDRVTHKWDMVISRVKNTVIRWWSRGLNLRGKVTVWNA